MWSEVLNWIVLTQDMCQRVVEVLAFVNTVVRRFGSIRVENFWTVK
jgi:hypothetical protein